MSFRCEFCKKAVSHKTQPIFVVTKNRERIYVDENGQEFSRGWEVVQEKKACRTCAETNKSVEFVAAVVSDEKKVPVYTDENKSAASVPDLRKKFNGRHEDRRDRR